VSRLGVFSSLFFFENAHGTIIVRLRANCGYYGLAMLNLSASRLGRMLISLLLLFGIGVGQSNAGRWRVLPRPTTNDLIKLFFLDSAQGWVVGRGGTILRTVDGGTTWIRQETNLMTDIVSITMLDRERGYALSFIPFVDTTIWYGTRILKTTNGGDAWSSEEFPLIGRFQCVVSPEERTEICSKRQTAARVGRL
jgi:hypothetical protein